MKRRFFLIFIIGLFGIMLLFPKPVFNGASEGLLLWFQIVLPTLLPFIIISNLMIHTNAISFIARILGPFLNRILGVSGYGSFAVLAGFLCGYPMGAKVTSDLLKKNYISVLEGQYLLSFCNNTSPMFILSYVVWQNLKDESLTVPSIVILFLSPVICSFFFRSYYFRRRSDAHCKGISNSKVQAVNSQSLSSADTSRESGTFNFSILDSCMMDSFEAIVKVGGYIMLFSILIEIVGILPFHSALLHQLFLPMLEVTNGIPMICAACSSPLLRWILVLSLTSFGGFCAAAQTNCMIQGTGLSIFPYIIQKLITMLVTSLIAYAYIIIVLPG